ncbi:hypothetical protein J6590_085929 [Homalodisca vitripennis]|nr:hypothetical protein J6590_085929 [Homalodisca vitripennis]
MLTTYRYAQPLVLPSSPPAFEKAKHKSLTILHQNTDRIANKIERLNTLLNILKPDLIVTEHGLTKDTLSNTRLIGYSLIAEYCRKHHQKGGVAIFTNDTLKCQIETIDTYEYSIEVICEVAIAKIELDKSSLYLVGVYRTKGNFEEGLDVVSDALERLPTNKPVVIMGDINIDS